MVKKIDSDALGILTKALGLSGAGSPITELADGVVDQALDVAPIVRRSRTQAATGGIYIGGLENVHGAGTTLTTSTFPYNVTVGSFAPYPVPMPLQFDIWLLSATMARASGTGTVTAQLQTIYGAAQQGFGVDDGGAATGALTLLQTHAYWDTLVTGGTGLLRSEGPEAIIGLRLPRPSPTTELRFTSTSSAAATYVCLVTLGVFPVALGQDGLQR